MPPPPGVWGVAMAVAEQAYRAGEVVEVPAQSVQGDNGGVELAAGRLLVAVGASPVIAHRVVGQVPAHGGGQVAGLGRQPLRPLAIAARGRVAESVAADTGRAMRSGALGRIGTVRSGLAAQGSGIGALRGCAGPAYLRAPVVLISGPPVAARAAGASRRVLPAEVPSVMPVPVMKTSSSTPAGMARFARFCRSSR